MDPAMPNLLSVYAKKLAAATTTEPFASRFANFPYVGEVAAVDAALAPPLEGVERLGSASRELLVQLSPVLAQQILRQLGVG